MTNEEAIEFIKTDISRLWDTPQNLEHKEALEKAIKALTLMVIIKRVCMMMLRHYHQSIQRVIGKYDIAKRIGLLNALGIIDKHKAESEDI